MPRQCAQPVSCWNSTLIAKIFCGFVVDAGMDQCYLEFVRVVYVVVMLYVLSRGFWGGFRVVK